MISIGEDIGGDLALNIDDEVAWLVSPELRKALIKECKNALGGEFADEFDPIISKAIDELKTAGRVK